MHANTIVMWALIIAALIMVFWSTPTKPRSRRAIIMLVVAVGLVIGGLIVSVANAAGASVQARPAGDHDVQCVAGTMGVAGGWIVTVGSAPTTAGTVTAGAAVATSGATVAWADMCPEYAKAAMIAIVVSNPGTWVVYQAGKWLLNVLKTHSYRPAWRGHRTFWCKGVAYNFYWEGGRRQYYKALKAALHSNGLAAKLYMGDCTG